MKTRLTPIWITGALLVAINTAARSQQTSSVDTKDNEDVLVMNKFVVSSEGDVGYFARNTLSSSRISERLVDIPQNIQIVNETFLNDVGLDNGIDAFKYSVSGINKKEATSGDIMLRGFRVGNSSFLWNGVNFQGSFNIPLYDIERIEVIKGPAALLFGAASQSGGIVNYVSKDASAKALESSTKLSVGSFNLKRGELSSSGPLGNSNVSYRVTAALTDSDHRRKWDHINDRFISLSGNWAITPKSSLKLYYNRYKLDQLISVGTVDTNGRLIPKMPADFSEQEEWSEMPRESQYGSAVFTTEISPTLFASAYLNFSTFKFDYKQNFYTSTADTVTGLVPRRYRPFAGNQRLVNLQMDMVKTFSTGKIHHTVTLGGTAKGEVRRQRFVQIAISPQNIYNPVYNTPLPSVDLDVFMNSTSTNVIQDRRTETAYLHDQIKILDGKILLVGGYGYTHYHGLVTNVFTGNITSNQIDQAFYKRYGMIVKPTPAFSLYYSYTEDFKFSTRLFDNEHPRAGQTFDPISTKNREVGIKAETSDGRLFGSIVYFDMLESNGEIFYITPSGLLARTQGPGTTNKGFEADIGLSMQSPLGAMQTILTYYGGDSKDFSGVKPDAVANNMWSVFISQSCDKGLAKGLKFGAGVYYRGKMKLTSGPGQTAPFYADDYVTTTAFFNYTRNRVGFSLSVDNLFDKFFVESGDNANGLNLSLGRTFKASVGYRF